MDYIVSGHGGRWSAPEDRVIVPAGFTVKLYVRDGEILQNTSAWPIYNHLLAGDTTRYAAVHTVFEGGSLYNYSCWNYPELGYNSCVVNVGAISPRNPIINLAAYPGSAPLSLKTMFTMLSPGCIHWVACRSVD